MSAFDCGDRRHFIEQFRFAFQTVGESEFGSRFHRIDRRQRGRLPSQFLARLLACGRKDRRVGCQQVFRCDREFLDRLGRDLTRELHRTRAQIAVDDPVDDSQRQAPLAL